MPFSKTQKIELCTLCLDVEYHSTKLFNKSYDNHTKDTDYDLTNDIAAIERAIAAIKQIKE